MWKEINIMSTTYELLGSGVEEMKTALNYDVTSVKDVLGQSKTKATKGNNTIALDEVTINPNSGFAKFVDTAIERQYELSELEKEFLFVKPYKTVNGKFIAFKQKAIVVPQEWAAGNQDLMGSVELNLVGDRTFGTFDPNAVGEKFTAETAPPTEAEITYATGDAKREQFGMYFVTTTA